MSPPAKCRRLFDTSDPDAELHERRARNDKKLKSRFESIFEKYSKDFSGIGDVIDFEKDEIVVDNGHLWDMRDEKDPGYEHSSKLGHDNPSSEKQAEPARPPERVIPDSQEFESDDDDPLGILEGALATNIQRVRTATVHPAAPPPSDRWVEPAWRVPLLPADVNVQKALPSPSPSVIEEDSNSSRSASPEGVSIWALPKRKRRADASGNLVSYSAHYGSSKFRSKAGSSWTPEERELLRQLKASGLVWGEIEKQLPSRTPAAIKMFWCSLKKKSEEPSSQNGNIPSDRPLSQSLGDASDMNEVSTDKSNRPLQVKESDTSTAPSLAGKPDAELEDDLASLLVPEFQQTESSAPAPKGTVFPSNTIIPDSQDSLETQQTQKQSSDPQTDVLASSPTLENGREDFLLPEVSVGTATSLPLPGSSSHTSSDVGIGNLKAYACDQRLQCVQTLCDTLQPDHEAYALSSALTESHGAHNEGLRQSEERTIYTSTENSADEPTRSTEYLVKDAERSSFSGKELSAPSAPFDDLVGRLRTPNMAQTARELPDSRAIVGASPVLVQSTPVESAIEQMMHELERETVLSDIRSSPAGTDPQSDLLAQANNEATDVSKPSTEAASTPQKFVRIEISSRSNRLPEKYVVSGSMPHECLDDEGKIVDQQIQYNRPVTPPRALLPAQEDSLRKIKPFSLILPIEGSPTRHEHLQWKSPYLQSLDQKYRSSQGETPSDVVSPRIGIPQAIGSDRFAHSMSSTPAVTAEDLGFLGNDSAADQGPENDMPPERAILQKQILNVEDDEDDLQLSYQPPIARSSQSKKRQIYSARKQQLAFRPKIDSDDISDDELSTPSETTGDRVEMTPIQASTARAPRMSPSMGMSPG
ncbi:MAG: hypothetical protein Q9221_002286 [Calogaya cf. arnoldii]